MIEPQNTMMPLAADPAPADQPQGEEGFGAMLAQTLGMVPQLDPNAIQQITGRHSDNDQDAADLTEESAQNGATDRQPTRVGRYATIPVAGSAAVADTRGVARPPVLDGVFVDPVPVKDQSPTLPTLPEVPLPQEPDALLNPQAPTQIVVEDAVTEPVRTADAPSAGGDSLPETPQPVVNPAETPAVAAAPAADPVGDLEPVDPVLRPRPEPPPRAPVVPSDPAEPVAPARPAPTIPVAAEPAQPVVIDRGPIVEKPYRGLPIDPAPTSIGRSDATPTATPSSVSAVPTPPRPDVQNDAAPPVRVDSGGIQMPADTAAPIRESVVRVDRAAPTAQSTPNHVVVAESSPQPTTVATPISAPAAPIQHSALAERVMQAVELQANQPPPRTMLVDIPEIEGLRLVVSVRSGAEVHVVPATASTATGGVQPFLEELQGVLENRGFVMTGDDRGRRGQRQNQDEPPPPRPARPSFRRAERTDNDLRI